MDEISVRSDSMRVVWHISDNLQNSYPETSHWRMISRPHAWRPPTDVYETDNAIIIRVEVAGMRETDFSISLVGRNLTIRGIRQDTSERRAYHQMEIRYGEFSCAVGIPLNADQRNSDAHYKNGFLTITLPKLKSTKDISTGT